MSGISVAVIDDHPLMLEAIQSVLLRRDEYSIVATGVSANDVLEICRRYRPDMIIVDLQMPGDVYAAITISRENYPDTKLVAFTAAQGVEAAIRALDAGVNGYILKGCTSSELIDAISAVRDGETYITKIFATQVINGLRDSALRRKAAEAIHLSIREQQIVRLLMIGKTNKEIAATIKVSEKTVKYYMTILMQKLQVRNRVEAVIASQRLALNLSQKTVQ